MQITTALGNLLRISLSRANTPFTLEEEVKLLENYIIIQKLRYPQRLEYTVEIPPAYYCLQLPKFTIQPILENAIRYGLEEISEVCHISIRASVKENVLLIEVKITVPLLKNTFWKNWKQRKYTLMDLVSDF